MSSAALVLYGEEYQQIKNIIARLCEDANARMVFLIDKNGQKIADHGDVGAIDTTSLASLTAGNVAPRMHWRIWLARKSFRFCHTRVNGITSTSRLWHSG